MIYKLPDGRLIEVHDDVARGAPYLSFTLKNGTIVIAIKIELDTITDV